jgi:hypothetical protein
VEDGSSVGAAGAGGMPAEDVLALFSGVGSAPSSVCAPGALSMDSESVVGTWPLRAGLVGLVGIDGMFMSSGSDNGRCVPQQSTRFPSGVVISMVPAAPASSSVRPTGSASSPSPMYTGSVPSGAPSSATSGSPFSRSRSARISRRAMRAAARFCARQRASAPASRPNIKSPMQALATVALWSCVQNGRPGESNGVINDKVVLLLAYEHAHGAACETLTMQTH